MPTPSLILRTGLVGALVVALAACTPPNGSSSPAITPPTAFGSVTMTNKTTVGLTLSTHARATVSPITTPVLSTALPVAADGSSSIKALSVDTDYSLTVADDQTKQTVYSLVKNGTPAVFRLSSLRAYTLDFSTDAATSKIVWSWALADRPEYEVSALQAQAGIGTLTLTWKDPTLADLKSIEVTPPGGTPVTVPKGTQTYTVTGLADSATASVVVRAVYPEISSRGLLVTGTSVGGSVAPATVPAESAPVVPKVSSTVPASNDTVDSTPGTVSATFSTPIDPSSVSASSFSVSDGTSKVAGTLAVSGATVTFTPTSGLTPDATHTVTLTGIKGVSGGTLASAYTWSFKAQAPSLFQTPVVIPITGTSGGVAIADVTGDGHPDILSVTSNLVLDDKLVLIPWTTGGWTPTSAIQVYDTTTAENAGLSDLAVGDINGDGKPEVLVAERNGIEIFGSDGAGKLKLLTKIGTSSSTSSADSVSYSVAVGDFNGDDKLDVAGMGFSGGTLSVWLQNASGGGLAATPVTYTANHEGRNALVAADVNGDGRTDLVVRSGQGFSPSIVVLLQNSSGTLDAGKSYSLGTTGLANGLAVGDFTGDGKADLAVSSSSSDKQIGIFAQGSGNTFSAPVWVSTGNYPSALASADYSGDGKDDLLVFHCGWSYVGVHVQGTSGLEKFEHRTTVGTIQASNSTLLAVGNLGASNHDVAVAVDAGIAVLLAK